MIKCKGKVVVGLVAGCRAEKENEHILMERAEKERIIHILAGRREHIPYVYTSYS